MARLSWDEDDLLLRLNWLEKLGDLSLRIVKVPLTAIQTVEVVNDPHSHLLSYDIDIGFAGNGAPARKIMTLKTRAKIGEGGRAAVVEYLNRPAVVVRLGENTTPWRILVVSSKHAAQVASAIRDAAKV